MGLAGPFIEDGRRTLMQSPWRPGVTFMDTGFRRALALQAIIIFAHALSLYDVEGRRRLPTTALHKTI